MEISHCSYYYPFLLPMFLCHFYFLSKSTNSSRSVVCFSWIFNFSVVILIKYSLFSIRCTRNIHHKFWFFFHFIDDFCYIFHGLCREHEFNDYWSWCYFLQGEKYYNTFFYFTNQMKNKLNTEFRYVEKYLICITYL